MLSRGMRTRFSMALMEGGRKTCCFRADNYLEVHVAMDEREMRLLHFDDVSSTSHHGVSFFPWKPSAGPVSITKNSCRGWRHDLHACPCNLGSFVLGNDLDVSDRSSNIAFVARPSYYHPIDQHTPLSHLQYLQSPKCSPKNSTAMKSQRYTAPRDNVKNITITNRNSPSTTPKKTSGQSSTTKSTT
jgi:hypothetical protein